MKTIYFKLKGGKPMGFLSRPAGWLVLGDHFVDKDGTVLLSGECTTAGQVEEQAVYLKTLIDDAVKSAKRKLAQS